MLCCEYGSSPMESTSTCWLRVTLIPMVSVCGLAHWMVEVFPNSRPLRPPVTRVLAADHGPLAPLRSTGAANSLKRTNDRQATVDDKAIAGMENIYEDNEISHTAYNEWFITYNVHNRVEVDKKAYSRDGVGQEGDEEVQNTIAKEELPELRTTRGDQKTNQGENEDDEIREHGYTKMLRGYSKEREGVRYLLHRYTRLRNKPSTWATTQVPEVGSHEALTVVTP